MSNRACCRNRYSGAIRSPLDRGKQGMTRSVALTMPRSRLALFAAGANRQRLAAVQTHHAPDPGNEFIDCPMRAMCILPDRPQGNSASICTSRPPTTVPRHLINQAHTRYRWPTGQPPCQRWAKVDSCCPATRGEYSVGIDTPADSGNHQLLGALSASYWGLRASSLPDGENFMHVVDLFV